MKENASERVILISFRPLNKSLFRQHGCTETTVAAFTSRESKQPHIWIERCSNEQIEILESGRSKLYEEWSISSWFIVCDPRVEIVSHSQIHKKNIDLICKNSHEKLSTVSILFIGGNVSGVYWG